MSHYLWVTAGDLIEARRFAQSAQDIAETLGDFRLQASASHYLGVTFHASGDYRQAEAFLRRVAQSLEGDKRRERCGLAGFPAAMARAWLAWALSERGEFEEGIAQGQEGIRIAEALDHPYSLLCASWGLWYLYGLKGEFSEAGRLLERSLALARDSNVAIFSPIVTGFLGDVYARVGRVAEGLPLLDQGLNAYESMGFGNLHSLLVVNLGGACVLAGRFEDALECARRALRLTRQRRERGYEAWALRLLGEIASRRDALEVGQPEALYRDALALADELGMRPLVAHCHLGLGKLYRRTGQRGQAQEHLATATSMYREMDMRFWLEQAEAELKALT